MEQNVAKGSVFLKVTGILMIIGGSLSAILSIIQVLGISALIGIGIRIPILYVAGVLALASAAGELTAGIVGIKNCQKPEKAKTCIVWGVIVVALCIISSILIVVAGSPFPTLNLLLCLVLPVLYIIGAIKNKQA